MEILGCVGLIVVLFSYLAALSVVSGWVLTHLWRWFVMPVFAVSELSIVQAVGLGLLVSYLTYNPAETKDERTNAEKAEALIAVFLRPFITLALGYIVHQFA